MNDSPRRDPAQWQDDPLVTLTVQTRHPQDYVLTNEADGTVWRASADGTWKTER